MDFLNDSGLVFRRYKVGDKLFAQGDDVIEAGFIQEGRIRIYKEQDNKDVFLGEVKKGDFIGEMALISGRKHSASAEALEDTTLVVISKELMDQKISHADPVLAAMIRMLIKRLYNVQSD